MRTLVEEFKSAIEDRIDSITDRVNSGTAQSFDQYKDLTGQFKAYRDSINTLEEILYRRLGEDADD